MHLRIGIALSAICLAAPAFADEATPPSDAPTDPKATPPPTENADDKPAPDNSGALKAPPAPPPSAKPESKFTFEPYGYIRMQYRYIQDDPTVTFIGRDDGFELQNARLGVRGTLLDKRAAYALAFDGAVDERAQINVPEGKLRTLLKDAWADVALGGETSRTVLRAGYFLSWNDPEAQVADTARELIDHPIESRGVRATEGYQTQGLPPGRSLGVALRVDQHPGDPVAPGVGFELAVQNGADEYSSNNDNDLPAVSAAVLARLPHDGYLVAAVRYNPRTVGELPARRDEDDLQATAGAHVLAGPVSLGAGFAYTHTTFPTTGGPAQTAIGGHAQVLFIVPAALPIELGYRFGLLDPSSLIVTDRVMEHTLGATLAVPELHMRFQAQFVHVVEQAERSLDNDRFQLAGEVAL